MGKGGEQVGSGDCQGREFGAEGNRELLNQEVDKRKLLRTYHSVIKTLKT